MENTALTLVCLRSRTDVSDAERRKGPQETGRRTFDSREAALVWLADKKTKLEAKGLGCCLQTDVPRLIVWHSPHVQDFYQPAVD